MPTSLNIETRQATLTDAPLVYDITEAAMRRYVEQAFGPWVDSYQRQVIGESFDTATHRVILVDDEVAGIVAAPVHETHIQLEKLYLLPGFQRRGIGSTLLPELQQSATLQRKPIRLRVLAVNVGARQLYERTGFIISNITAERVFMEYRV